MSKSTKNEKKRWRYWLYMLLGALFAMLLAGIVIALIFTLPVSWLLVPVVGAAVASVLAFAVSVGLVQTILIAASVVLGAGLFGGLVGRGIQALVESKIFSKAKQFVIELFPSFFKVTLAKAATTTTTNHAHANRRLSGDIATEEQSESLLLQTLFNELNEIDLKKDGWVSQLTELRNKRIKGQEEKILNELTKHGPALCRALVADLRKENLSKEEIEAILEKSFIKKLRILFHTDKSDSTLASQIFNKLEGWMNQVRELFNARATNDELKEALREMQEDSKELRERFERYSARVDKYDANVKEYCASIDELSANSKNNLEDWARLRGKADELARTQAEAHVKMTARREEDRKALEEKYKEDSKAMEEKYKEDSKAMEERDKEDRKAMEERVKEDRKAMEERDKEDRKAMFAELEKRTKADFAQIQIDMQRQMEATLQAMNEKMQTELTINEDSSSVSVVSVGVFSHNSPRAMAPIAPEEEIRATAEPEIRRNCHD